MQFFPKEKAIALLFAKDSNRPNYRAGRDSSLSQLLTSDLLPRILRWVRQASWLVVSDILDAEILEHLEQDLAYVGECHGSVVRIALLNQHVTIEAAHLVDGEDTDTTK